MDDLLHRLRHDMVELSSQGDNFTQQIWLMYGQFEQVVDRFNPPTEAAATVGATNHSPRPTRRSATRRRHRPNHPLAKMTSQRSGVVAAEFLPVASENKSRFSDSESDSEPEVHPSRMARERLYGSRTGRPGLNPLLETISVIGDLCDSDDAVDGPTAGLYAGSNSVDSGYKSSCPTPDLAQDASNYISGRPPVLKSRRTLPAVPAAATAAPASTGNHQIDGGLPLDLDHLTSLRRTLLTAIERYDTRTKELDRDLLMTVDGRRPRSISPEKTTSRSRSCAASRSCRLGKEASADQVRSLADNQPTAAVPPVDLVSGGQAEQQTDQDGATRFSRVARCMLEIIEDLQRQQQQQQQEQKPQQQQQQQQQQGETKMPVVPPKPSRMVRGAEPAAPAPATPPRVARRGRRKLPTPQPPSAEPDSSCSSDLTGADYHLYEEIIYDLGSSNTAKPSSLGGGSIDVKMCPPVSRPPPLPARPSRPSPPIISNKPWLNVIKPLRRDRNNQLIRDSHWTQMTKLHTDVARSNVYTFGSQPQPQTLSKAPRSAHHHEDEYGFRAVSHMV